jgi:AcrR family transcriptional regulator
MMPNDPIILGTDGQSAPSRSDALQNRAEILDVARRLFDQYGAAAVTMSQIAQEAGVGKGTLYRNFSNKAELCLAMLDEGQRDLQNRALTQLRTSVDTPYQLLVWLVEQVLLFVDHHGDLLCEIAREQPEIIVDSPAHRWQWITIVELLRRAGVEGDIEYLADAVFTMIDVRMVRHQRRVRGYSFERILDGITDLIGRHIPA